MDTYLENLKNDLAQMEGKSKTKVAVSPLDADNLANKIARFAFVKAVKLQNIDEYTLFLIISMPVWRKQYLNEINSYDSIFTLFSELSYDFQSSQTNSGVVDIPSSIYKFGSSLPSVSDQELIEAFEKNIKFIENEIGPDEIITAEILNKFLGEKIIDEVLWNKTFENIKEKEVIKKYKKDKTKHLPDSLEELKTYEEPLPKKLISYARTTTYRLRQYLEKKTPDFIELDEEHSLDQPIHEHYDQEMLLEIVNKIKITLTEKERLVIELEFHENLSQKEIADKLNITQQMVSKHKLKALKKFRKGIPK